MEWRREQKAGIEGEKAEKTNPDLQGRIGRTGEMELSQSSTLRCGKGKKYKGNTFIKPPESTSEKIV